MALERREKKPAHHLRVAAGAPSLPCTEDAVGGKAPGAALPDHRRCDAQRVALRPYNRGGSVALTLRSLDGDVEYLVRKW
ncbi:MAG: hypothetical protein ACE37N_15550 [Pseudohongiellaceae bacterium]